jgi:hypothetical protein
LPRWLELSATPLLGALIAAVTWPFAGLTPTTGIDPSWVEGLYMATERGMHFGTQIVFSFGPLGFLEFPGAFSPDLGRLAFLWSGLVQLGFCISLLWCTRRAFGVGLTLFVAALPSSDRVLVAAAVVAIAAVMDEWSPRQRLGLALAAGIELLGSLRAGPTLAALPERRRTFLFRGAGASAELGRREINVIAATAGDGLLLRVPPADDYPGVFALGSPARTISFARAGGFLTGLGTSPIQLEFRALALRAPGTLPGAG